jgi:RimJ/RimL family protein N-acetyltransferase
VLGFTSIYSYSEIGNKASQRVSAKIGLKRGKTFEMDGIEEVVYEFSVKESQ